MAKVQHTRNSGKRLTYDIEANRNGSFTILLAGKVLASGHDPLVTTRMRRGGADAEADAIQRAIGKIEMLVGMAEE